MKSPPNNSSLVTRVPKYPFVDSFPKNSERNSLIMACCFAVSNSLAVVKGLQFPAARTISEKELPAWEGGGGIFLYIREVSIVIIRQPARESSVESGGSSRWSSSPLTRPTWPRSSPSRGWIRRSRAPRISQSRRKLNTGLSKEAAPPPFSG